MSAPEVAVGPAASGERATIEALFQLYVHDFSQWEPPGSTRFALGDDGRFQPYPDLADYWREADRWPLLIRASGELAGFALLNTETHSGRPADLNVAEFFVARKFRGQGVAAEAARLILQGRPGLWEIAVAERNAPALRFWPRAVAAAGATRIERIEGDGQRWRGPIWRFRIEAAAAR